MKKTTKLITLIILVGLFSNARADKFSDPASYKAAREGQVDSTEIVQIASRLKSLMSSVGAKTSKPATTGAYSLSQAMKRLQVTPMSLPIPGQKGPEIHSHVKAISTNGTPVFVSDLETLSPQWGSSKSNVVQKALEFITEYRIVFGLENPAAELVMRETKTDELGQNHVFFEQMYQGIPYWKKSLNAHFLSDGTLSSINARYAPSPRQIDPQSVAVDSSLAVSIAHTSIEKMTAFVLTEGLPDWMAAEFEPVAAKYIWTNEIHSEPRIVWQVELRPNIIDWWFVFVDATTGAILEKYNNTQTDGPAIGSGIDLNGVNRTVHSYLQTNTFYMIDASKPSWVSNQPDPVGDANGGLLTLDFRFTDNGPWFYITSSDNNGWLDPVSVSAHFNVGTAFDYFFDTHGRLSIDGNGGGVLSVIHETENGLPFGGAYWNGTYISYGDGDVDFKPLAGGVDVVAHEMTHGVIQNTVGLVYRFKPGALNESICDVFGTLIDTDDWRIGEDVVKLSAFPSGALRDLSDPHNGGAQLGDRGWQPAHMSEFLNWPLEKDHGGVHFNSGIPNHAAFLIGQALGREKLGLIYYRILDVGYLNPESEFVDMRIAAIQSASDLFGPLSVEAQAVENAFDAVGILDGPATEPPPDRTPVLGNPIVAIVNDEPGDNSLYLASPTIPVTDIRQLSTTQVFTGSGKPMDAPDDGSEIIFVDSANFLRAIVIESGEEIVFSPTGIWSSVAFSPDGSKFAATTLFPDSLIFIFDLDAPENSKAVHLYQPTTAEGVKSFTTRFADVLDWDQSGEFLLYDAFNRVPKASGGNLDFWNIYLLDVANEVIVELTPPLPEGTSLGNPSFAQLNDRYIVFDLIQFNICRDAIIGVDLFLGEVNVIIENGCHDGAPNISYPKFSPDDSWLMFEQKQAGRTSLRQVPLADSRIDASGAAQSWIIDGQRPLWFVQQEDCCDTPGDATGDNKVNIADVTFLISWLFAGGESPACCAEGSANGDDKVNIADVSYIIAWLFGGGPDPICGPTDIGC